MGVSKGIRSILFAAAATFALASAPARAATTLTLTVDPVVHGDPPTDFTGILVGQANDYELTIENTGTETATGIKVSGTLPDDVTLDGITKCDPADAFPCTQTVSIPAGKTLAVTVTALGVVPPVAERTCLAGPVAIGDSTFTVVADNAPAVTATVANTKLPYTNLVVEMTPAPADVEPGSTHTVTTTVTNEGPCPVGAPDDVVLSLSWASSYTVLSATGNCALGAGETIADVVAGGTCVLGAMPVDGTQEVSAVLQVPQVADDLRKAVYDSGAEVAIVSSTLLDDVTTNDTAPVLFDDNADDDSAAVQSRFASEDADSSCSTGGAGALLSLLPLLAARAWRRRKA